VRVVGVVLCGGMSRRMRADKAGLRVGGAELLDRAIGALDGTCDEVVLACGADERYAERGLRIVLDSEVGRGPLEGIAASLEATGAEWVCVLACDLPRMVAEVPQALLAAAREGRVDGCLLETPRGVEPLIAVYKRTCLGPMRAALQRGERRVDSFYGGERAEEAGLVILSLAEAMISLEVAALDVACNLNTIEELERERQRLGEVGE
jgi:molybdopterin-guanine dinucleotide biosynthesis protein A